MIVYLIEMQLHALVLDRYKLERNVLIGHMMHLIQSVLGSPSNSYIYLFIYFIQPAGLMGGKKTILNSPIHTFDVDRGILTIVVLCSGGGETSLPSEYNWSHQL